MTVPVRMPSHWYHPYTPTLSGDLRWVLEAVLEWADRDIEERSHKVPRLNSFVRPLNGCYGPICEVEEQYRRRLGVDPAGRPDPRVVIDDRVLVALYGAYSAETSMF